MAQENRPAATNCETAKSNSAGDLKLAPHSISAEDRHAAFCAGLEQGRAERVELAIEEQVRARLHQLSLEALGMARRHAANTGPAWASLIEWAGSSDD